MSFISSFFSTESSKAWAAGTVPFLAILIHPVAVAIGDGQWDLTHIWSAFGVGLGTALVTWAVRNKPAAVEEVAE